MALAFFRHALILVRGGGDLASGVIYRLHRAGFPVVVTELETPVFVRRAVCYGEAVYSGAITIDGVTACRVESFSAAQSWLEHETVPVVVDPDGVSLTALQPAVVVDARMAKTNLGTRLADAPLVVALGPGFTAGVDCHAVIETNRGHNLGRVITGGTAEADTGEPGVMSGHSHSRVLRAPAAGYVQSQWAIGDTIAAGQVIASVAGEVVTATFTGVLRGLIHEGVWVVPGMKIGDLDPRAERSNCFTISDKSLAVGGGALEAVLAAPQLRRYLPYETATRI